VVGYDPVIFSNGEEGWSKKHRAFISKYNLLVLSSTRYVALNYIPLSVPRKQTEEVKVVGKRKKG
jgi:hypothetical protein